MKDRVKELIEKVEKERGFVMPWRRMVAERDPDYLKLYHNMAMHIFHKNKALPLKYKEIICICIDAVTFHEKGLRAHVRNALAAGATEEEIFEALECCTLLSVHHLSSHIQAFEEEVKNVKEQQGKK